MGRYKLSKSEFDEGNTFEKLPEGQYVFQITDFKEVDRDGNELVTKKGDPQVNLTLEVVLPADKAGRKVWHNVIFYKPDSPSIKGIGMTRHFLHCANLPYQGDLDTDPNEFVGKRIRATVVHNDKFVNLDEIIMDEKLFSVNPGGVTNPKDLAWEE
jgi:hypothetical protein